MKPAHTAGNLFESDPVQEIECLYLKSIRPYLWNLRSNFTPGDEANIVFKGWLIDSRGILLFLCSPIVYSGGVSGTNIYDPESILEYLAIHSEGVRPFFSLKSLVKYLGLLKPTW